MKLRRTAVGGAAIVASLSVGLSPAQAWASPADDGPGSAIQPDSPPCQLTASEIECPADPGSDPADEPAEGPVAEPAPAEGAPAGAWGTYGPYEGFGPFTFGPFGPPITTAPALL